MKKDDAAGQVGQAAGSLKDMLGQLEKENKKLSSDLDKKRKATAVRLKQSQTLRKKMLGQMDKLDASIKNGQQLLGSHKESLGGVKKLMKQQEQTLQNLMRRMGNLESGLSTGKLTIPDARRELMKMLEELGTLKKQREKIMSKTGMVNATTLPSFRLDPES